MQNKYQLLLDSLTKAKNDKLIILLYRGVSKEFAFEKVNLDTKYNTLKQFAERLFFFGEKSRYFWNDKIKAPTINNQFQFDINDTSDGFFEYIFEEFNSLIRSHHSDRTSFYFNKNRKAKLFFQELGNLAKFVCAINQKANEQKVLIRNYYLTILHQLGKSKYKQTSQFISSSTNENATRQFSRGEIVINFWELNFNKDNIIQSNDNIPVFKGKPYKNQKELSVFTAILPHFIYSFKFEGKIYKNPAINNTVNFDLVPLTGLDIKQDNFTKRLIKETNYSKGVMINDSTYKEI